MYWAIEYIRTVIAYGFVMFLWPMVVFNRHLRGKSRTYGFAFCTLGMILLTNLVVLGIGLIPHALHGWVIRLLFFGAFFIQLIRLEKRQCMEAVHVLRKIADGTMGRKSFLLCLLLLPVRGLKALFKAGRQFFKGHLLEYGVLCLLTIYAMIYFGWGAFDAVSYGSGDMYVHHAWIYGLQTGRIFSSGIYPEGMHTFIYLVSLASGVRIYSLMLFTAGIHIAVLCVSVWLFLREVFQKKYMPDLILLLFLILDHRTIDDVYAMSRLQWTIPEEFALYTEFLCGLFLLRFIRYSDGGCRICHRALSGKSKIPVRFYFFQNDDLRMFAWAVAASFATHFYVTIMAGFICLGVVLPYLRRVFRKRYFIPILTSVVLAVTVALVPMAGAFAEGRPLQGSLGWALDVMRGTDTDATQNGDAAQDIDTGMAEQNGSAAENEDQAGSSTSADLSIQTGSGTAGVSSSDRQGGRFLSAMGIRFARSIKTLWLLVYKTFARNGYGFSTVYTEQQGMLMELALIATLIVTVLLHVFLAVLPVTRQRRHLADPYFTLAFTSLIFICMYAAPQAGVPQLIAGQRLLSTLKIMLIACGFVIPDLLLRLVPCVQGEGKLDLVMLTAGSFIIAGIVGVTDSYHGFLYYELTRYPGAVNTTNRIIHEMPADSYTIVSTTDELYQVNLYGYHEELLTFVQMGDSYVGYTIPSKYIYLYIEKKPLKYAQSHFFKGPKWLGITGKYYRLYKSMHVEGVSQCSDITHRTISTSEAEKSLNYSAGNSKAASDLDTRVIMESKAMKWMQTFMMNYPDTWEVYYEDEDFICYKITQDPQVPDKLGFFAS
ncbi:MAG: hypothetical protein ACI4ET_01280 [Bilifractor sp.]